MLGSVRTGVVCRGSGRVAVRWLGFLGNRKCILIIAMHRNLSGGSVLSRVAGENSRESRSALTGADDLDVGDNGDT
jgi:hypothetical protein